MKAFVFVSAVAGVAASVSGAGGLGSGLVVLDPTGAGSLKMVGNSSVTIPTRSVYINSSHPQAVSTTGSAVLDVPCMYIVGGASFGGGSHCTGQVIQSNLPYADPIMGMVFPAGNSLPAQNVSSIKGPATLSPGYYASGLSIAPKGNVTLEPGVYVFGNSVTIKGAVLGEGVTLIMANGALDLTAQADITLSPPKDGSTAGVVIAQPASNTSQMSLSGGSNLSISGTIYTPGATLLMVGNSSVEGEGPQMGDLVVTHRIDMRGTADIKIGRPEMRPLALPKLPLYD